MQEYCIIYFSLEKCILFFILVGSILQNFNFLAKFRKNSNRRSNIFLNIAFGAVMTTKISNFD